MLKEIIGIAIWLSVVNARGVWRPVPPHLLHLYKPYGYGHNIHFHSRRYVLPGQIRSQYQYYPGTRFNYGVRLPWSGYRFRYPTYGYRISRPAVTTFRRSYGVISPPRVFRRTYVTRPAVTVRSQRLLAPAVVGRKVTSGAVNLSPSVQTSVQYSAPRGYEYLIERAKRGEIPEAGGPAAYERFYGTGAVSGVTGAGSSVSYGVDGSGYALSDGSLSGGYGRDLTGYGDGSISYGADVSTYGSVPGPVPLYSDDGDITVGSGDVTVGGTGGVGGGFQISGGITTSGSTDYNTANVV